MNKYKSILMMGRPACGKGTQSEILVKNNPEKFYHISTGELIREHLKDFSGKYIDDLGIKGLVEKEVQKTDSGLIYILDGVPRTFPQIKMVEGIFDISKIFLFLGPNKKIIRERMIERDRIGDNFEKRIKDYVYKTIPVENYYNNFHPDLVSNIDAKLGIEEISKMISKEIGLY